MVASMRSSSPSGSNAWPSSSTSGDGPHAHYVLGFGKKPLRFRAKPLVAPRLGDDPQDGHVLAQRAAQIPVRVLHPASVFVNAKPCDVNVAFGVGVPRPLLHQLGQLVKASPGSRPFPTREYPRYPVERPSFGCDEPSW